MAQSGDDHRLPIWRLVAHEQPQFASEVGSVRAGNGEPRPSSEPRRRGSLIVPRPGQRVRLLATPDDPEIIPGALGTVGLEVARLGPGTFRVAVEWDDGTDRPLTEIDRWELVG